MEIIINKPNHIVVKTSFGRYVDDEGLNYPFHVDISETEGEKKFIEISWDDDEPKEVYDIETELLEIFVGVER